MTRTLAAVALFSLLLSPRAVMAQSAGAQKSQPQPGSSQGTSGSQSAGDQSSTPPAKTKAQKEHEKKDNEEDNTKGQQTTRMLWVAPNFAAVSANAQLPPLSAHGKFVLAFHDSFDYSAFTWTAIEAAQGLGLNSDSEFGHGWAGYGRYYWHNFVDGASGTYFTEAIVPALSHEDPRYYTRGAGGFSRRLFYALSRTVVTKTDSGGTSFNWSEVGGNALEAALSNAYYPATDRGGGQTARNWAVQMESAALNNVAKEFWPDFRRKVLRRK